MTKYKFSGRYFINLFILFKMVVFNIMDLVVGEIRKVGDRRSTRLLSEN